MRGILLLCRSSVRSVDTLCINVGSCLGFFLCKIRIKMRGLLLFFFFLFYFFVGLVVPKLFRYFVLCIVSLWDMKACEIFL